MTATLNMIGGASKAERNIHIIGTKGEIKGVFDDSIFAVRKINQSPSCTRYYDEEIVDLKIGGDKSGMSGGHGGGDLCLSAILLPLCAVKPHPPAHHRFLCPFFHILQPSVRKKLVKQTALFR